VPISHEDVAVARDSDGGGVEFVGTSTRLACLPSVMSHLPSGLNLWTVCPAAADAISHPDVALEVNMQAVWEHKHASAKRLH
jgi:hypothetical protein